MWHDYMIPMVQQFQGAGFLFFIIKFKINLTTQPRQQYQK